MIVMQEQIQTKKTGTTTVGIVCKDCVILASESKSTLGYLISSKTAQKVYQIDDRMAVTTAGSSGDAQALVRLIQAEINIYKLSRNNEITVNATATLLSNILQSARWYPYWAMLILGGVDNAGGHVYSIDPIGGVEEDKYSSTGSGSPIAYGVLEDSFREGLTKDEGVRLAVRAIRSARERDIFSGGRDIDKEKIKELAK